MYDITSGKLLRKITDAHPPGSAVLHVKVCFLKDLNRIRTVLLIRLCKLIVQFFFLTQSTRKTSTKVTSLRPLTFCLRLFVVLYIVC